MSEIASKEPQGAPQLCRERRRSVRQLTLMRIGLIHARAGNEFCLVKNLSAEGLMARVYGSFRPEEEIRVELTTGHILAGTVVWASGVDIGVRFQASIDVGDVLSTQCGLEMRRRSRLPRLELRCPAVARFGSRFSAVTIANISQRGVKIVAARPVPATCEIVLGLPDLPAIHGTVRWSQGDEAGIFFNESLPFTVLARWVDERRQLACRPRA
jgi:hypothetical protein